MDVSVREDLFYQNESAQNWGGISISHGHSLEINAKQIGKNLHVFQNVTIGSRNTPATPIIGDNVTIGAGAVVLGDIKIGNNVKIGANAVVVDDIPDNCTVVPDKSKVIKFVNK